MLETLVPIRTLKLSRIGPGCTWMGGHLETPGAAGRDSDTDVA